MRRLTCLAGATVALLLTLPPSTATAADGPTGSANYACGAQDVNVTMSIDAAPPTVRPGQTLRLTGTLTLGFTSQTTLLTRLLLSSKAGVSSADFGLEATTADRSDDIDAVAVQGEQTKLGQVMALDARAVLEDYTVPDDAAGDLLITLPRSFSTTLSENGLISQRTLDCDLAKADVTPLITRIPVEAQTAEAPGSTGASTGPVLSVPESTAGLGPASPTEPAPSTGADPSAAPDQSRPVFAAVPPSTRTGGVVIPYWSIALVGLAVPLASVVFALSLRHRMRVMQRVDEIAAANRALTRGRRR